MIKENCNIKNQNQKFFFDKIFEDNIFILKY